MLARSSQCFAPLQDPLLIDFTTNRWFAGSREESYSDWLAWLLSRLSTAQIFNVLKIEARESLRFCETITPRIERESYVAAGHEGQSGRLDIRLLWPRKLEVQIEVKLGDAESADLEKHAGYCASRDKSYQAHRFILIVTSAAASRIEEHSVLTWSYVCIELRALAKMLLKDRNVMLASLLLAFVGTVEQNLLHLPAPDSPPVNSELLATHLGMMEK